LRTVLKRVTIEIGGESFVSPRRGLVRLTIEESQIIRGAQRGRLSLMGQKKKSRRASARDDELQRMKSKAVAW